MSLSFRDASWCCQEVFSFSFPLTSLLSINFSLLFYTLFLVQAFHFSWTRDTNQWRKRIIITIDTCNNNINLKLKLRIIKSAECERNKMRVKFLHFTWSGKLLISTLQSSLCVCYMCDCVYVCVCVWFIEQPLWKLYNIKEHKYW